MHSKPLLQPLSLNRGRHGALVSDHGTTVLWCGAVLHSCISSSGLVYASPLGCVAHTEQTCKLTAVASATRCGLVSRLFLVRDAVAGRSIFPQEHLTAEVDSN